MVPPPGAERDAGQRLVGDGDRQAGGVAQHEVEIAEQRAAAGEHDALVDDVGGQFRRGVLERDLDRLDDGADRLGQALGDLPLADDELLGHAVHQVAALDLHGHPVAVLGRQAEPISFLMRSALPRRSAGCGCAGCRR
jgi:hypothetical protein